MKKISIINEISIIICLLVFTNQLFGQESNVKINNEGKDYTGLKHAWKAQWITHPTESTLDSRDFLFRRSFVLVTKPKHFTIFVSADNRYRLYVNGSYLISGPSSGDLNHYRYETIDIAPYLVSGANVVAAEVVNFGEYRKASTQTFQTAFILQGDRDNPVNIDTGKDSEWKVLCNKGFESIPFVSDSLRGYYAAGPGERLISGKYPWGWKEIKYDDSRWLMPRLGTIEFAVGRGFLYGSTWYLVPRVIPFMEETQERFKHIARSNGVVVQDAFLEGKAPIKIPANQKVSILIDQAHHTIGHPVILYSCGKGAKIKITYSEALYDSNWKKGNRNDIKGKNIMGYYDEVFPDGGTGRVFKPIGQKTYRYIQLDINTQDDPLVIEDYYGVFTAYPFKENARFLTNDSILSKIWKTAWRTLRNSSVESFIDPYYEQLQYIGDTRIEALISIVVDGDDRLMRKAIEMFDNSRLPNGLTQSRYPSYIVQVIPTYSLLWINMLHDYFMYKDDDEFLKRFIPGIKTVLDWWIAKIDETGMPTGMEWWNFTDWSPGFRNGIPPGADDGYSACVALQLVKALQNGEELLKSLGDPETAQKYTTLEKRIIKSVIEHCFVPQLGMIAETPEKKLFSQHTNILAILTNTIPVEAQETLMEKILNDKSLIQTTLYYKFYLFNALQKVGMGNKYLGLLDNWINQLNQGLTTFAETDIDPRSECHAWSASPNYHFLSIVAGIHPGEKHFGQIVIEPHLGFLTDLEVAMPHPKGMISMRLQKHKSQLKGYVSIPKDTKGIFRWEGKEVKLLGGYQKIEL